MIAILIKIGEKDEKGRHSDVLRIQKRDGLGVDCSEINIKIIKVKNIGQMEEVLKNTYCSR